MEHRVEDSTQKKQTEFKKELLLEEYRLLWEDRRHHIGLSFQAVAIIGAVVTWILKTALVDADNLFLKVLLLCGAALIVLFAFVVGVWVAHPHFVEMEDRLSKLASDLGFRGPRGRLMTFLGLSNAVFATAFIGIICIIIWVL